MKISLQDMRKMDIYEEIDSPEIVYHMTSRSNAKLITEDRRVKTMGDYITWFFTDPVQARIYIYLVNADEGRAHYGLDGKTIVHEPPLDHKDTVILKLRCRKEPLMWYREVINKTKKNYTFMSDKECELWEYMNNIRICHFGDLRFSEVLEVIELTEIDKLPEPKEINEIRMLREEG